MGVKHFLVFNLHVIDAVRHLLASWKCEQLQNLGALATIRVGLVDFNSTVGVYVLAIGNVQN